MRDTFIFYRSFKDSMNDLSDADKLIMYEAISDYSLDLKEPELTGFPKALFSLIRPILDANIQRWRNGRNGGAPKGNKNNRFSKGTTEVQPKVNQNTTEVQANKDKDKDVNKDKSTKVDKSNKPTRFSPPTLSEVQKYISDNNYSVDAANFIDYYTANGWKVNKNPMKDWQATIRNWQRREKQQRSEEIGVVLKDNSASKYDNDKLW